ncbi:MAG: stage III sporulation protein AG [Oscillospiraceae bacterium]|jgi:stage III sporulation protein AG|nr:stage III sporulation protein AG [Oscillospiraceae bacterium]
MGGVKEIQGKIWQKMKKGGWAAAVLAVGLAMFLIPGGAQSADADGTDARLPVEFSLHEQEYRMAEALSSIDGAGSVKVMLTLSVGPEQVLQKDSESSERESAGGAPETELRETSVVISQGGSTQSAVAAKYIYPKYRGALVIAEGAGSADVRLELLRAVSGLTGLGADKITVAKMKVPQ